MDASALALMRCVFLYGTLRDLDLLAIVLGREVSGQKGELIGFETCFAAGETFPMIALAPTSRAPGILLTELSEEDLHRLDYYEGPYGYVRQPLPIETSSGPQDADVYMPPAALESGDVWDLDAWQKARGPVTREAAKEEMAAFGILSSEEVAARSRVIMTRAQARVNARTRHSPSRLRSGFTRDDVVLHGENAAYSVFFKLDELQLTHRRFSGAQGEKIDRAVFVSADATTVLPYDPKRDTVLLIEQFRASLYQRGDPNPWSLEAIAGRIDPFETSEEAARREAQEEAGIDICSLHEIGRYYSSPGANTEYLTSFVGLADLPLGASKIGGLETEAEDIRSIVISFEDLMAAVASGEAENAPLILSALWLQRERERLRETG